MAAAGIYWNRDCAGTSRRRGTAEESPSPKWSTRRSPSSGDAGGCRPLGEVVGRAPPRGVDILVWRKQGTSLRGHFGPQVFEAVWRLLSSIQNASHTLSECCSGKQCRRRELR